MDAKHKPTRKEIRDGIMTSAKFQTRRMTLFGQEVEVKQPSLDEAMKMATSKGDSNILVDFMVGYVYVPDSDEKVFEDADRDTLKNMPFGKDIQKFQKIALELAGIDEGKIEEEMGN